MHEDIAYDLLQGALEKYLRHSAQAADSLQADVIDKPLAYLKTVIQHLYFDLQRHNKVIPMKSMESEEMSSIEAPESANMAQWLKTNQITPVPEQYKVEMSKFCQLDQYSTTHVRIAGIEQGKLQLFFHRGDSPVHSYIYGLKRSGELHQMNWKLLKVSADMTLIVMYTEDMREKAVQQILAHRLPGMQA